MEHWGASRPVVLNDLYVSIIAPKLQQQKTADLRTAYAEVCGEARLICLASFSFVWLACFSATWPWTTVGAYSIKLFVAVLVLFPAAAVT